MKPISVLMAVVICVVSDDWRAAVSAVSMGSTEGAMVVGVFVGLSVGGTGVGRVIIDDVDGVQIFLLGSLEVDCHGVVGACVVVEILLEWLTSGGIVLGVIEHSVMGVRWGTEFVNESKCAQE